MKLLFTIPHYFDPAAAGGHGSLAGRAEPRLTALSSCLAAIYHLFGNEQKIIDIAQRLALPANLGQAHEIDVVICTVGDRHLLAELPVPISLYWHRNCQCAPPLLGFECQQVLADARGRYDYYCYLEDDLVLTDPWFFAKLAWFTREAGDECLLQAQRFEMLTGGVARKVYIDGDLRLRVTARFRDQPALPDIEREVLGVPVRFRGALNPHAGCYFLTAAQLERWTAQPWFLDRDSSFIGPLESAATLGILRTFNVYKAVPEHASFLEIRHFGASFLAMVGREIPVA